MTVGTGSREVGRSTGEGVEVFLAPLGEVDSYFTVHDTELRLVLEVLPEHLELVFGTVRPTL